MTDRTRGVLQLIGLAVGIASLGFTLYRTYVLEALIQRTTVARLSGLFVVTDPAPGAIVPARSEVTVRGTFIDAIPPGYDVRAVVIAGGRYYVSRSVPVRIGTRWSVPVRPSPGAWELGLCLVSERGAKAIDRWAAEKTRDGEVDWTNSRQSLPEDVQLVSTFPFVAVEGQTPK